MNRWHHAVMAILGVFLLVLLPAASPTHSQTPPSPEDIIQGAWRKANASSTYRFRTDLQQTLYPALRLSNAGSTTVQDQFYVEGQIAPPSEDFSLRLWRGGESPESAYEIRMADGQASGRIAGGEWQALDANTELYAPGGDPLSYLNAIKNAHPITNTTSQPSHSPSTIHNSQFPIPHSPFLIPHSKFSFDLDSPAFANMMREQLQRQLIESGQLPAGMSVEIADIYRDMTAQGELWVDEDGLPLRLKLSLAFPPEADGSQVKADIQTDFFDFAPALAEEQAAQALLGALHLDGDIIGPGLVVGLLALALTMLAADHRPARRRLAYVAVVSVVVLSMLVTPLLQSVQAAAFYDRQAEQRAAYEAQRAEHLARAEQLAATSAWDPTVNPLESASPTAPSIPETGMESNTSLSAPAPDFVSACSIPGGVSSTSSLSAPAPDFVSACSIPGGVPSTSSLLAPVPGGVSAHTNDTLPEGCSAEADADSDGDGLTDRLEAQYGSLCNNADSDTDGLNDGVEVLKLGTDPVLADTDGDGLLDNVEVGGLAGGLYSDPLNMDSNYDGLPDGLECPDLAQFPDENGNYGSPEGTTCIDTDGDGTPDIFDPDNDGDGVSDSADLSPFGYLGDADHAFTQRRPFSLIVDDAEGGQPLFVDFQLRTKDPEHLGYAFNALDWPTGDTEGQVQRRLDTTFHNTKNDDAKIEGARGDLRLVPMLEITIPDAEGNYGNLPTISDEPIVGSDIDEWLDVDRLRPYGVTISRNNDDLIAYVPLSMDTGETSGEQVALSGRMLYWPDEDVEAWGNAHQVRLIWIVQMLTDVCTDPDQGERFCNQDSNRQDTMQIVHTYYDDWYLTGLKAREDHGLRLAVAFEDPAPDTNRDYDPYLWQLARGLGSTFIGGRDADGNGQRDITVPAIQQRFDKDSNGGTAEDERWGVPQDALRVAMFPQNDADGWYDHQGFIAHMMMTETQGLLATYFDAYKDAKPTFLFAQEERARVKNLDQMRKTHSFALSLEDVNIHTTTGLNWMPYRYDTTAQAWEVYPLDDYLTAFRSTLGGQTYFAADRDADSQLIAAGRQQLALSYYQGLYWGLENVVQVGTTIAPAIEAPDDDALADAMEEQQNDAVAGVVYDAGTSLLQKAGLNPNDPSQDVFRLLGIDTGGGKNSERNMDAMQRRVQNAVDSDVATVMIFYHNRYGAYFPETRLTQGIQAMILMRALQKNTLSEVMAGVLAGVIIGKIQGTARGGFLISQIQTWGVFAHQVSNTEIGSIAFNQALSQAVAATVVAGLILALSFSGVGLMALAAIGMVDTLLTTLCGIGLSDTLCGGLTGFVAGKLASLFYDAEWRININDRNRLKITDFDVSIDPNTLESGYTTDVRVEYALEVSNALTYDHSEEDARKATFNYDLQTNKRDIHRSLRLGQMSDEWVKVSNRLKMTDEDDVTLNLRGPGINQAQTVYLTEGYAAPVYVCHGVWYGLWIRWIKEECDIESEKDSNHILLGEKVMFDVFPKTLDEFYTLTSVGGGAYRLGWDNNPTLPFPAIWDADGDTLGNPQADGIDPDDSRWDTDGDGLSDAFEIASGTDPVRADPDGDGLTDARELVVGTNPRQADTDSDGLNDAQELEGSEFVYRETAEATTTQTAWVWSDPLDFDTDDDGLSDFQEYAFGMNPRAISDPNFFKVELQVRRYDGRDDLERIFGLHDGFNYTATVESTLENRNVYGLLDTQPAAPPLIIDADPQNFFLSPSARKSTLHGDVTFVEQQGTPSGVYTVTQRAGGVIASDAEALPERLTLDMPFDNGLENLGEAADGECSFLRCPSVDEGYAVFSGFLWPQYATLPTADVLGLTDQDFTVAATVFVMGFPGDQSILGTAEKAHNQGLHLIVRNNKPYMGFYGNDTGGQTTLLPGQPYHIVWRYTKTTGEQAIFVNGALDASSAGHAAFQGTGVTYLGSSLGGKYLSGGIDDIKIYPRALSDGEIRDMFADARLSLPLDDAPGATSFNNHAGEPNGGCTGTACPVTGVAGRIGQAAWFDGEDDAILMPVVTQARNNVTLAAWVKWGGPAERYQHIISNGNTGSSGYGIYIKSDDGYKLRIINGGKGYVIADETTLIPNVWQHVVAVRRNGTWTLYLDGSPVAATGNPTPNTPSGKTSVGGNQDGNSNFNGWIDDVHIYETALSEEQIQGLYHSAPVWHLRLDDALGTTEFLDSAGTNTARCTGTSCPQAGAKGQVYRAAQFDGSNDALIADDLATTATDNVTLMAWVKWAGPKERYQHIISNGNTGSSGYGIYVKSDDDYHLRILNGGKGYVISQVQLPQNMWQHVAAVRRNSTWELYLNGTLLDTDIDGNPTPNTPDGETTVGSNQDGNSNFNGWIDEVQIYNIALSTADIYDIAQYQGRWVEEYQDLRVTLDLHPPDSELLGYTTGETRYYPATSLQLAASAIEDYTSVDRVELLENGTSLTMTPCEGAANAGAWCVRWPAQGDPAEGLHTLYTRATDAIGNVEPAQGPYYLAVDGTPPALSMDDAGAVAMARQTWSGAWYLPLSGGISDPNLAGGGTPGSGVEFVAVTLLTPEGDVAGHGLQHAVVDSQSQSWQLDYGFVETPSGTYTATIQTQDRVGNVAVQTVRLATAVDTAPPTVTLNLSGIPTIAITSTLSLSGAVVEHPLTSTVAGVASVDVAFTPDESTPVFFNETPMAGQILHWALEDIPAEDGTVSIQDISGQSHHGTCTTCPMFGEVGHIGRAASFDGSAYLQAGIATHQTNNVSLAAWVQWSGRDGWRQFILNNGNTGRNGYGIFIERDGALKLINGGRGYVTSDVSLSPYTWQHVVAVRRSGTWELYLDGIKLSVSGNPSPNTPDGTFTGGAGTGGGEKFDGLLDEVQVYNRALAANEIAQLYRGSATVLWLDMDERWMDDGDLIEDGSGWEHHGRLSSDDGNSNKAIPGTIGPYALALDAGDTVTVPANLAWSAPQFAVAFWVKVDAGLEGDTIIAQGEPGSETWSFHTPGANRGVAFKLQNGSQQAYQWSDTDWHHVIGVYDGRQQILYVDGVEQARNAVQHTSTDAALRLGRFSGALDDVRIYPRGLSAQEANMLYQSRWRAATVSATGSGVREATWSATVPSDLEGGYQIDLRASDALGQSSLSSATQWSGLIDTLAPRISLSWTTSGSSLHCKWGWIPKCTWITYYNYDYSIQDFDLTEESLSVSCGGDTLQRTYYQSPWYRALAGDANRLYALSGACFHTTIAPQDFSIHACDMADNCTTTTASVARARLTEESPPALYTGIFSPTNGSVITQSQPISLGVSAVALDYLQAMSITQDGAPLYSDQWDATDALTQTAWFTNWTPIEGQHVFQSTVSDWNNGVTSDTITFTVDTQPPQISMDTHVLTRTHYDTAGLLTLSGLVTDTGGVQQVQARLLPDGDWSPPATVNGARWYAAVPLPENAALDGAVHTFTAQVTDIAQHTAAVTESRTVDVLAPQPVTLTVRANGDLIMPGTTLREISPTLTLTWTASSDGSSLADYRAEWHSRPSYTTTATTALTTRTPGDPLSSTLTASEAQEVNVTLVIRDAYGNARAQSFGPLYVDIPLTPDYIPLPSVGGGARGGVQAWLDSGCTQIGVDRRSERESESGTTRDSDQRLYISWDTPSSVAGEGRGGGLRLAWTGANWGDPSTSSGQADGDLFIYLDTQAGGAFQAYDPYSATMFSQMVILPGNSPYWLARKAQDTRGLEQSERQSAAMRAASAQTTRLAATQAAPFEADYAVWVQDSATAWLLRWDGWDWISETLSTGQYHFAEDQTDLYLPFDMLGITDPTATPLNLLAFASEEDALELWATFPNANPLSSPTIVDTTPYEGDYPAFALSRYYAWEGLGAYICPNGNAPARQRYKAQATQAYPDTDLHFNLSVAPVGTVYSFLGDDMYFMWDNLFGFKTADISTLFDFTDHQHPPLGDTQTVTYTFSYRNLGQDTATNVWVDISAWYALRLPDGEHLPDEERDHQVVPIGSIAPGETGSISFQGMINLAQARAEYYEPCVAEWPDWPAACAAYIEWATLDAFIYDDAHPDDGPPLDWQWVDHQVDSAAPAFFDITQPGTLIGPGHNTFSGYAYDASGVDSLTLDLTAPTGGHSSPACPGADASGTWRCTWDATQANGGTAPADGDTFSARLQATDSLAQTSPWSAARTFVVDALPPTLTLALTESTPVVNGSSYRLTGALTDNRGLGTVAVCWADAPTDCAAATLNLEGGLAPVVYTDTASTPLPIDPTTTCDGNELVRPFTVTQNFTVGQVALNIQAEHTYRDDVLVNLRAPDGTQVRVLFGQGGIASTQQNYNVALADSAPHGLYDSRYDDDLDAAPRNVRPYAPLRAFAGLEAAGVWTLRICDTAPWFDDGAYHASRLALIPRGEDVAPRTGTWAYNLPLPAEQDGVTHTLHLHATDLAGNRSLTTLDLVVDNVGPVITVTEALDAGLWNTATQRVLSGAATDGGGPVISVTASVQTPDGSWYTGATARDGSDWQYDLLPTVGGVHALWVTAQDAAGNQTVAGAYPVAASLPPQLYKTASQPYATLGSVVTYTLAIRNRNPETVHGIVVADPLPQGLTLRGTGEGTAYIPLPGNTLVWPAFDLAGGDTAYLEFAATVSRDPAYYGAVITNTAYLTATGLGGSVSNIASLILEPAPGPAPINKTVATAHGAVRLGDTVTYTIVAANPNPKVAVDAIISDTLPAGVRGPDLYWTGVLSVGQQLTLTLPATVTTNTLYYGRTITNVATLKAGDTIYTSTVRFTIGEPWEVFLPLVMRQ